MKVYSEYEEVLERKKSLELLGLDLPDVEDVLRFPAFIGRPFDTHFLFCPNLKDESDTIFVELAVASGAKFIVTSNTRDFQKGAQLRFPDFRSGHLPSSSRSGDGKMKNNQSTVVQSEIRSCFHSIWKDKSKKEILGSLDRVMKKIGKKRVPDWDKI